MSEAHATLTDKDKRERYAKLMKEGGETPEQQHEIVNVVKRPSSSRRRRSA